MLERGAKWSLWGGLQLSQSVPAKNWAKKQGGTLKEKNILDKEPFPWQPQPQPPIVIRPSLLSSSLAESRNRMQWFVNTDTQTWLRLKQKIRSVLPLNL